MAVQTITEPVLTDTTGQQILTAIQDLAEAVQPTNVYVDIAATLSASNWSSATPSVYTWTNSKVTGECAVEVFFATGASSAPTPYIEYEKGVGSVIFYAPTSKPTVDLPVVIRIINAEAEIASDIDADMVATDAISGASNVQEALTSVNSSIGQLNSKFEVHTITDCNTYNDEGVGRIIDSTLHRPFNYGVLKNYIYNSTGYRSQLAMSITTRACSFRTSNDGGTTWTDWQELALKNEYGFITVLATTPNTIDTWGYANLPSGYSTSSAIIVGHTEQNSSTNVWFSNNPSVTCLLDGSNQIRVKSSEDGFLNSTVKIVIMKLP